MITSIPIGSWSWDIHSRSPWAEALQRCVETSLVIYGLLDDLGCVSGAPEGLAVVQSTDPSNDLLFSRGHVPVIPGIPQGGPDVVRLLRDSTEETAGCSVGLVSFWLACPGKWTDAGTEINADRFLEIDLAAWSESTDSVTLHTYSDAWLTHNLRGRKQPEVHAANAPRLSAALRAISEFIGAEPYPGDPTCFATPTTDGFEALPDEEPELLDSWEMFEVPYRLTKLELAAPPGQEHYSAETEGSVHYVTVAHGSRVLGYLWEANTDAAAGFEPRSAAGEAAFEAGTFWLTQLASTKSRGLSPTEALEEFRALDGAGAGRLLPGSDAEARNLSELRDLAGRI
ncbi:hypothetical protein [Streptomyces sp. URMC 123]|uniref:hypothetical protein n=1 Tax=Streptomyces sp. URMC 123 TaxID=3423403 RepID=UPI003F1AECC0